MNGLPSLLWDSHEPDAKSTVITMETMATPGLPSKCLLSTGREGEIKPDFYPTTVLSPLPSTLSQGKELFSPWKPRKNILFGRWPSLFLAKWICITPCTGLVAQHRWPEPGSHASNVGTQHCADGVWINTHPTASTLFLDRGKTNMLSICLCCLV